MRFPNFARLARGSTWFEHAATVGEGTTHAIPAILTGRFPKAGEFPVYTDHRQNLFTLFGGAAALHVVDHETHLCPPSLCSGLEGSLGHRAKTLAEDTGVVYLHELLPDDLTGGIPSIANGWDDFLQDASKHNDPGQIDPAFLESLRPGAAPALWYLHLLLPHSPWAYLPSGDALRRSARARLGLRRGLDGEPGRGRPVLAAPPAAARLRRPRARAAARPAPRERALRPRRARRHRRSRRQLPRRPETTAAVAGEPPGHRLRASVREAARAAIGPHGYELARTIDILPTLADAAGVRIPWSIDGHSLLRRRPVKRSVILDQGQGAALRDPGGRPASSSASRRCDANCGSSGRTSRRPRSTPSGRTAGCSVTPSREAAG